MKPVLRRFALVAPLLALAACQSGGDPHEPAICPRVSMLADSQVLYQFRPGDGRDAKDVTLSAELTSFHGDCRYDAEDKKMLVQFTVGIDAERRPGFQGKAADFSYFVAIPAFYPNPDAKVFMPVHLDFPSDAGRVHYEDGQVEIAIPLADLKQVASYEIFVGMQLTADQLAYNRKQHGAR